MEISKGAFLFGIGQEYEGAGPDRWAYDPARRMSGVHVEVAEQVLGGGVIDSHQTGDAAALVQSEAHTGVTATGAEFFHQFVGAFGGERFESGRVRHGRASLIATALGLRNRSTHCKANISATILAK